MRSASFSQEASTTLTETTRFSRMPLFTMESITWLCAMTPAWATRVQFGFPSTIAPTTITGAG